MTRCRTASTERQITREISVPGHTRMRRAVRAKDHPTLIKLASWSKFTAAFSSLMCSSPGAYDQGWIRAATYGGNIVGLTCVRPKVYEPKTVLYFLTVHPTMRGLGVGAKMLRDLERQSPHNCLKFNISKDNPDARRFFARHGYRVVHANALRGTSWGMERTWE